MKLGRNGCSILQEHAPMNTTSFLDKQIMDLSQGSSQQNDFIGLMNHPQEVEQQVGYGIGLSKKEEILSNYGLLPMRPIIGSSFQSPNIDAKHNLGGGGEGSTRAWNSSESKSNTTSPIRNYGSLDSIKPSEFILEKDRNVPDATIVSEIDRTMKKHVDSLLHVLEGVSEKLTQLESRTRHLENSVDDLKISVGNNHGNTDGKMRQLENVLRDVHQKEFLLKDLITEGLLRDDRRIGEVCSKRVYRILMAQSGSIKTDDVEDGADLFRRQLA